MIHTHEELFNRHLPVKFTEDQVRQKAEEMASKYTRVLRLKEEMKSAASGYKSRIEVVEAEVNLLSKHVTEKCEYQNVKCRAVWDTPEYGEKSIFRMDTGELVGTERMEDCDRQLKLRLEREADQEPPETPAESPPPETTSDDESAAQERSGEEADPKEPKTLLEELEGKHQGAGLK